MTINEAIAQIDELKPNYYSQSQKIKWLSDVDDLVKRLIIDTHTGSETILFKGYSDVTPMDTELLVPAPFENIYLFWMGSKMDYHNGEFQRYNNSISAYQAAFNSYRDFYNSLHKPKSRRIKFF